MIFALHCLHSKTVTKKIMSMLPRAFYAHTRLFVLLVGLLCLAIFWTFVPVGRYHLNGLLYPEQPFCQPSRAEESSAITVDDRTRRMAGKPVYVCPLLCLCLYPSRVVVYVTCVCVCVCVCACACACVCVLETVLSPLSPSTIR